ncbi:MAG: DUF3105 domain-containing protein [Deltaproteobacteria bacterium]|nr:DUF3105 domain-containing protein [Deltaproteobacteria bacterium]
MRWCLVFVVVVVASGPGCGCGQGVPLEGACVPPEGAVVVNNEGWAHKNDPVDHVYESNPPASGPHYPVWASWGVHADDDVVERGQWVHNLEHGGIVLLLGDSASDEAEEELRAGFDDIPGDDECGHSRTLLTLDPELDDPVAVVAADTLLVPGLLDEGVLTRERIVEFALACRNHSHESICY